MTKCDSRGKLHDETGKFVAKLPSARRPVAPRLTTADGGRSIRCRYCGGRCIAYGDGRGRKCYDCKLDSTGGETGGKT